MEAVKELFVRGGPLMYAIAFCSVLALGIFLERLWVFAALRRECRHLSDEVGALVRDGRTDLAEARCLNARGPIASIFLAILHTSASETASIRNTLEEEGARQVLFVNRHLGLLSTIATVSPLLGLLGTVLGMIQAFNVIAARGSGTPATLGGGISQALLTTAAGLSVAIPTILLHRYLSSRASLVLLEMEERSRALLHMLARRS